MYYGIKHGYIRFGTLQHKILKLALEAGWVTQRSIMEEFDMTAAHIANTLIKLTANGFLYKVGKIRSRPEHRSGAVWALENKKFVYQAPLTQAERDKRYYAKRRRVVNASIFTFRGRIEL